MRKKERTMKADLTEPIIVCSNQSASCFDLLLDFILVCNY